MLNRLSQVSTRRNEYVTPDLWVVSLIATDEKNGGHARIIVEGYNTDAEWLENKKNNPEKDSAFIGEYHIMANATLFNIMCLERSNYTEGKITQYSNATTKSYSITKDRAVNMINAIKFEQANNLRGNNYDRYGINGHNCVTWCEEFLQEAQIYPIRLPADGLKPPTPHKHAHPITKFWDFKTQEDNNNAPQPPINSSSNSFSFWHQSIRSLSFLLAAATATSILSKKSRIN